MQKVILLAVILCGANTLFCDIIQAKRLAPSPVDPVVYNGIKFIASDTYSKMNYIEAWDIKTQKKLWEKKVYDIRYDPKLEKDVQDNFIRTLEIVKDKLVVRDERGNEYAFDLPVNEHPVRLNILSDCECANAAVTPNCKKKTCVGAAWEGNGCGSDQHCRAADDKILQEVPGCEQGKSKCDSQK